MKLEHDINKTRIDNENLKSKENFMHGDISYGSEVLIETSIFSHIINRNYVN